MQQPIRVRNRRARPGGWRAPLLPALVAVALGCAVPAQAQAGAQELRAGAARVAITPDAAVFPYAPSDTPSLNTHAGEKPFVGVHDDIFARALVLAKGPQKLALVVIEVTTVPRAGAVAAAVARALAIAPDHVVIAASHTHNVPLFSYAGGAASPREEREIARVLDGAVQAARAADAALQPARIAFGRGEAAVSVNNGEQAGSRSGYDPAGPSDHTLDVLRLTTPAGAPVALLVNAASHAEVMFRSLTRPGGYEVSGDLPGAVSRLLEAPGAGAPVVLVTAGAEADQLPLFKSLQQADGALPATDEGAAGWALLDVQARRLAGSVAAVVAQLPPATDAATLAAAGAAPVCAGQKLSLAPAGGAITIEKRGDIAIPLAALRLGDVLLAGVGGDIASEIGTAIRARSPLPDTMVISMAGDSIGYILADASYLHPGHGISKSLLAPHCAAPAIVEGIAGLARETRAGAR